MFSGPSKAVGSGDSPAGEGKSQTNKAPHEVPDESSGLKCPISSFSKKEASKVD